MSTNTRFVLLTAAISLATLSANAQQKVFYRSNDAKLLTKPQLDSVFEAVKQRAVSQGMAASLVVSDKMQRGDSTFYRYSINRAPQTRFDAEAHWASYVGKKLPTFALKDTQGKTVSTAALVGKPVVINMWFTTCAACIEEMPELNKVLANPAYKLSLIHI